MPSLLEGVAGGRVILLSIGMVSQKVSRFH